MSWGILPITYESLFGKGADVVHFFNYIYPPKIKAKIITTIYDTSYIDAPETLRRRTKHLLDKNLARSCEMADKVIVISEYTKARIIELLNVDPNKIEIIYPGVDNNLYNTNTGADEQKIVKERYGIAGEYYLYLGTIEPRKNIVRLVEAYADLYQKRKDCPKLVLAGSLGWLYNPILDTINSSVAKEKILLTGYIEDKDVPALISGANAFVFPSIYEGFGMPPLEAMACGVPVIASGTTALKEVISGVGLEVNPYSVEEIENALERIVADTELRKTSVEKGIKKALEFTWEKSASKLLGVYDSI
jgi:glycosyltransferase involved in cell wall biosynthesis